jgi:hypothetical protein
MKKVLLILALFLFSMASKEQGFIDPANQWNVSESENFGASMTGIFKVFGDSVIGNKSYQKIFVTYDSALNNWYYKGLLREDSNKVYYISVYGNGEGLLYDFNLKAGDTTHVISEWLPEPREFVCQSVDSIIYNGISHKRWNFYYPYESWIDGIGSTEGPLYSGASGYVFDLYFSLLCFHRNDTLLYMEPGVSGCYFTNVGLNELNATYDVTLSPNPITKGQNLNVKMESEIKEIELFTSAGIKTEISTEIHKKSATIKVGNLPSGIYFLRLTTINKTHINKKITIK